MKATQHKPLALHMVALATLSCLSANSAYAHISEKEGYLTDSRGNLVRNAYNQCWRTGYWTPAMAIAECDPDLVKKEPPKVVAPPPPPPPPPAPAPVVAPPPPPPKPAVAAAPPPPKPKAPVPLMLTLSADALFDFNKADIKPGAYWKLNQFVLDLKGAKYDAITVTGHADRIGRPQYNMKLSVRRAEAVKAYLVKHGGIDPAKITAIGKGETEPVTKPGQCRGQKVTKALIACKQPDRRVEVEVRGTK